MPEWQGRREKGNAKVPAINKDDPRATQKENDGVDEFLEPVQQKDDEPKVAPEEDGDQEK